ncbi:Serine/threonine-protein phosphatase 5 [Halotydeus destructor]|nr:Serine/threonine-protein phosphatase 5 [Halotydeus destructor]
MIRSGHDQVSSGPASRPQVPSTSSQSSSGRSLENLNCSSNEPEDLKAVKLAYEANHKANGKDYYSAIRLFDEAIQYNKHDSRFYLNRSYCYTQLELYQLALDDAQQAINLSPDMAKCYYRKGQALVGLRKYWDAEQAFKDVLRLEPECTETAQELFKVRFNGLVSMGFDGESSAVAAQKFDSLRSAMDHLLAPIGKNSNSKANVANGIGLDIINRRSNVNPWNPLGSSWLDGIRSPVGSLDSVFGSFGTVESLVQSNSVFGKSSSSQNTGFLHDSQIDSVLNMSLLKMTESKQVEPSFNNKQHENDTIIIKNRTSSADSLNAPANGSVTESLELAHKEFLGFEHHQDKNAIGHLSKSSSFSNNNGSIHFNGADYFSEMTRTRNCAPTPPHQNGSNLLVNETKVQNVSEEDSQNVSAYNAFSFNLHEKLSTSLPSELNMGPMSSGMTHSNSKTSMINGIEPSVSPGVSLASSDSDNLTVIGNGRDSVQSYSTSNGNKTTQSNSSSFSYSDMVKKAAAKYSENNEVNSSHVSMNNWHNSFDGKENSNQCGGDLKTVESSSKTIASGKNSDPSSRRPTNLWNYWGLRVANVSGTCSKSTLQSFFGKYGKIRLIERINNKSVENNIWVYFDNATSPAEAITRLQDVSVEGISVPGKTLRFYFAPTDDQKDLKFSRPKQPADNKGECYYWRTTNCFSREQCPLAHLAANKNIDAQVWMKMNKETSNPKDSLTTAS